MASPTLTIRVRGLSIAATDALVLAIALGVVAVALALRIGIAWIDLRSLTLKVLPDDAYYYFETARRIHDGQNVAFDGTTLSNGYHPLWLFFLVPFYFFHGDSLPIHLALTTSSFLDTAAGILVALTVWKLTDKPVAGLFALTFYLLLPQDIFAAVNGVETSMAVLMLSALLFVVATAWREPQADWLRWAVITGVLGGLTTLARLDSALTAIFAIGVIAMFQSGNVRWQAPIVAGVILVLMVVPWLLWSYVAIGTIAPVSGESATYIARHIYLATHPGATRWDEIRNGMANTKFEILHRMPALYLPTHGFSTGILAGTGLVILHFIAFARGATATRVLKQLAVPAIPLIAFLLTLTFNSLYRLSVREWYYGWGMPVVVVLFGVFFAYLDDAVASTLDRVKAFSLAPIVSELRGLIVYSAVMLVLVAAFFGHAMDRWRFGLYPFQLQSYEAAIYLRENTAPNERTASFNAGIIGYISHRDIVNVDGVVNPNAYKAIRDHRLLAYIRDANVTYAADFDFAWGGLPGYNAVNNDWSTSFWGEDPNKGFVEVKQIGLASFFGQRMRVFRVVEPPPPGARS